MLLSILIPSIPERIEKAMKLYNKLLAQIGDEPVEVLLLMDNRKRSIGAKRNDLKDMAKGLYWAFCDDDDDISDNYIERIIDSIISNQLDSSTNLMPDVITFNQIANINNVPYPVKFGLNNDNEELNEQLTLRQPFHVCAWLNEKFKDCKFGDSNYGEDAIFVQQACSIATVEYHIDEVLHIYKFNSDLSRAENG